MSRSSTAPQLTRFSNRLAATLGAAALLAVGFGVIAGPANADSGAYTNGSVKAIAYDNNGGFYIGGSFTNVSGTSRSYLAHISSDATLDTSFAPTLNGTVSSLAFSGSKLYVGGTFSSANSTTRNNAAAFNTDGTLDSNWDPNTNGQVTDFALDGSNVYMSGAFTTAGPSNSTRNHLAVMSTSGSLGLWAPSVDGNVDELIVVGSNVYFGGSFANVTPSGGSSSPRADGAAVSTGGTLQSWNANTDGEVKAIASDGTNIYFGGTFTKIGSTTRNNAAAIAANGTSTPTSWNPNIVWSGGTPSINSIALNGNKVFLGGAFQSIKGSSGTPATRKNLAGIKTDNSLFALNGSSNPDPGGSGCSNDCAVNALVAVDGIGLASGGDFLTSEGTTQRYYAGPQVSLGTLNVGGNATSPSTPVSKADQIKAVNWGFYDAAGNQTSYYQWQRCSSADGSSCQDIVGKATTGAWYGTTDNDIGFRNRVKVYWNTVNAVISKFSALSGIVTPVLNQDPQLSPLYGSFGEDGDGVAYDHPVVGQDVKPQIGTLNEYNIAKVGKKIGAWQGYIAGVSVIKSQWQRCSDVEDDTTCVNIPGTAASIQGGVITPGTGGRAYWYTPTAADVGKGLRVTMSFNSRGVADSVSTSTISTVTTAS